MAALKAIMNQGRLGGAPGAVLVISVNRKTYWTVLEFRPWSRDGQVGDSLHIVRSPVMEDCEESEAWTASRAQAIQNTMDARGIGHRDQIGQWTRWVEILATGMEAKSLAKFGIDADAIEHRSWPKPNGGWEIWSGTLPITVAIPVSDSLPSALAKRIESFRDGYEGPPLAIVVDSPAGPEMIAAFETRVRQLAESVPVYRVTGADTARAAGCLAEALGRDPEAPAWLDAVPGIEIEVRKATKDGSTESKTEWMTVVPGTEAIPAGEVYRTRTDPNRHVTLAPGIEHVHLHLRRGRDHEWDERYSGRDTGHTIHPSDHVRIVEPLARVRPLSGEARIEIVEHRPDGEVEALPGSMGIKWSDMSKKRPDALRSIPDLYIFRSDEGAWNELECLLRRVIEENSTDKGISLDLKDRLYECTQKQWRERVFPLGSDGAPPRADNPQRYRNSERLLVESTNALLSDLERNVASSRKIQAKEANRLHLPLTWLFTGCPERTIEILLDAIGDPEGPAGRVLHMENEFSAWSIYSGVGRAARSEETLRVIFDTLIGAWENRKNLPQDRFLLAAVTHPMARRVAVRRVLGESRERFDRAGRFLRRHLENLREGNHDPRPRSSRRNGTNPSLELRYVTMGYRGLCQIRHVRPDWFDADGEDARDLCTMLRQARRIGRLFEQELVDRTAPYLIGKGEDPSMPGGF